MCVCVCVCECVCVEQGVGWETQVNSAGMSNSPVQPFLTSLKQQYLVCCLDLALMYLKRKW